MEQEMLSLECTVADTHEYHCGQQGSASRGSDHHKHHNILSMNVEGEQSPYGLTNMLTELKEMDTRGGKQQFERAAHEPADSPLALLEPLMKELASLCRRGIVTPIETGTDRISSKK